MECIFLFLEKAVKNMQKQRKFKQQMHNGQNPKTNRVMET